LLIFQANCRELHCPYWQILDEHGDCAHSISTIRGDLFHAEMLLYPDVDIPMSVIPANCSECLHFVANPSLVDKIIINLIRFNLKMISNTPYVNTFRIFLNFIETGISIKEVTNDIRLIFQNGLEITILNNQSIHLRADFAEDTLNYRLYPHILKNIFSDYFRDSLLLQSQLTENYFCRQVELQENEIAWVPGQSDEIFMTSFERPFSKTNYVVIQESGRILKSNQFILLSERHSRIRTCIENTNFTIFHQGDVSAGCFNFIYAPLFILQLSAVIVNIFGM